MGILYNTSPRKSIDNANLRIFIFYADKNSSRKINNEKAPYSYIFAKMFGMDKKYVLKMEGVIWTKHSRKCLPKSRTR